MENQTTKPDDTISSTLEIVGNLAVSEGGLTKREYFAAMALQGLLSNPTLASTNSEYAIVAVDFSNKLTEELNK